MLTKWLETILKSPDRYAVVDKIVPLLAQLKKCSYGKQITSIEKAIYGPGCSGNASSLSTSNFPTYDGVYSARDQANVRVPSTARVTSGVLKANESVDPRDIKATFNINIDLRKRSLDSSVATTPLSEEDARTNLSSSRSSHSGGSEEYKA